jgi:predicted aspartyl protease
MSMSSSILRTAIGGAFITLVASQSLVHILTQVQAKTSPYRQQADYAAPMRAYAPVAPAAPLAAPGEATIAADRLGQVALRDVDAYVAERNALGASLLGMTFLSRLSRIEAGAGKLVLRQ